ncbi:MAG: anhydro-N-acetylmuramic acid kinase, partial [Rubricella sp.]
IARDNPTNQSLIADNGGVAPLTVLLKHQSSADVRAEAAGAVVTAAHVELAKGFAGLDLIGFHGQTLAHDPDTARTHQTGNGAALALETSVPTVWDFRSADMVAGGQGAPLASFYHFALVKAAGIAGPVAVLNLGGVANVTWIDPAADGPEAHGAMLAFDTGPASALIDDLVEARLGLAYDENGRIASVGRARPELLDGIGTGFLSRKPPKSLDRHDFHAALAAVEPLSTEDAAATLLDLTLSTVAAASDHLPEPPVRWLVTGGGRRNGAMMAGLTARLGHVEPIEAIGCDGDMLEAEAFAHLAARSVAGLPLTAPGTTGVPAPVTGGRLSNP